MHCWPLKKHTQNPDSRQGGVRVEESLTNIPLKNLSKNIMLNNPPSSSFSSWQGFPNGKWLLRSRTYTLWSAEQLSTCLILHIFSSPSLICVFVLHRTGSLVSLCLLCTTKFCSWRASFSMFLRNGCAFFFSPASISHWTYPQSLIHVQWVLKYTDIG